MPKAHPREFRDDVVVALQIHRDLRRPEVVGLAQVDEFADDLGGGCLRMGFRGPGALLQPVRALQVEALGPGVEGGAGNPEIPAGGRHVPGHFLGMTQHRHPMTNNPIWVVLSHEHSVVSRAPNCQASTSVSYVSVNLTMNVAVWEPSMVAWRSPFRFAAAASDLPRSALAIHAHSTLPDTCAQMMTQCLSAYITRSEGTAGKCSPFTRHYSLERPGGSSPHRHASGRTAHLVALRSRSSAKTNARRGCSRGRIRHEAPRQPATHRNPLTRMQRIPTRTIPLSHGIAVIWATHLTPDSGPVRRMSL